jgi:hypothetical protein
MGSGVLVAKSCGSFSFKKNTPDNIPTNKLIANFLEASFPLACEEFQNHRERPKDSLEVPGSSPCFPNNLEHDFNPPYTVNG